MNKHILALLVPIFIEIFILQNFKEKIISRTLIHFLSIMNAVYFTTNSFRENTNFTKLIPLSIMLLDYIFGKFIIASYYDPNCRYFDAMHSVLIITIALTCFLTFTGKEVFKQFESSKIFNLHIILSDFVFVYKIFYFYKHFHLKHGNIIDLNYNLELAIRVIVDSLANNTFFVLNNLVCFYLSKERGSKELFNIVKRCTFMLFAEFIFYSIYSFKLARGVFEYVNSHFAQPNNLILYNLLPVDLDTRFRIFLYISHWTLA
jgi:hypothetical protein